MFEIFLLMGLAYVAWRICRATFRSVDPRNPPDYWPEHVRRAMKKHY